MPQFFCLKLHLNLNCATICNSNTTVTKCRAPHVAAVLVTKMNLNDIAEVAIHCCKLRLKIWFLPIFWERGERRILVRVSVSQPAWPSRTTTSRYSVDAHAVAVGASTEEATLQVSRNPRSRVGRKGTSMELLPFNLINRRLPAARHHAPCSVGLRERLLLVARSSQLF